MDEKRIDLAKNENTSGDVKKEIKIEDVNPSVNTTVTSQTATNANQTVAPENKPESVVQPQNNEPDIPTAEEISNRNKTIGTAGIAVAAVLFFVLIGALFNLGDSYKDPVKNYFAAMEKGSGKKLQKAYGDKIVDGLDNLLEEEDVYEDEEDIDDIDDVFDYMAEEYHDTLVDAYGKNIKVKYKITDKEKLDKDELKDIEKSLKEMLDEKCKVKKGYEIEVEATVKGKDDKGTDDQEITVIKLDGDWIMYDETLGYMFMFGGLSGF